MNMLLLNFFKVTLAAMVVSIVIVSFIFLHFNLKMNNDVTIPLLITGFILNFSTFSIYYLKPKNLKPIQINTINSPLWLFLMVRFQWLLAVATVALVVMMFTTG